MATVPVNGTELYFEDTGQGPALVFIHGMCGNANVWDDQVSRLKGRFRCITYDRRGHTRSPLGPLAQRSVELHADDAAQLIQALDLEPCTLVASSGGARIGVDVVRRYPNRLRGAVLSEPPIFALDPHGAAAVMPELQSAIERAMAAGDPREAVDAFFAFMCPGLWNRIDEPKRDSYRANHRELFGDLQMPPYQLAAADLAEVLLPCLILRGSTSLPVLRNIAGTLAAGLPNATMVELTDCGHVTYAEQPERFAAAVEEFARRVARTPIGGA